MVENVAADGELCSGGVEFGMNGKVRSHLDRNLGYSSNKIYGK